MSRGESHTLKQTGNADAAGATPAISSRLGSWPILALVFGFLVLVLRILSLGSGLTYVVTNPVLLKEAMRAAAGQAVSTVDTANMLPTGVPVSGFQARAMGEIAWRAGQTTTAEAWFVQGLTGSPSAFLSQFELCRLYWDKGERDKAREDCRGTKTSAIYWLNRGYEADQAGDRAEALAAFQMAGSVDPELTAAWQQAGHTLFALGRFEEAIPAYERVVALEETPPADVIQSLGWSYLKLNEPLAARRILTRGLELYPYQQLLFLAMAQTYRDAGDMDTADEWYARLLDRWPRDARGWASRGEMALADGRYGDAVDYFQETVNIQPDDVGYWVSLATAAAADGNLSLAATAYKKGMALRPDDAALWLRSGRFLVETGRGEEAVAVLEHVLELEPDNGEAAALLAGLRGTTP
ncbi:MAG: tetratricopeptide repeat protein [Anaerolineae bacterium]|nr:tetratricopeptide repeat protein [Anaerolineae bacterium]